MNIQVGQKNHVFAVGALGLGLSCALISSAPAQAAIINGDFSSNFDGWDIFGFTSIVTPGGNPAAQLEAGAPDVTASVIETFLGLAPGSLEDLSGQTNELFDGSGALFLGSALKQSFTANAGDIISFTYNFTTSDYLPFNDFAFTTLSPLVEGLASVKLVGNTSGNTTSTGPRTFSWAIPTAGTYTLGFGVINVGDNLFGSTLVVDDVSSTPIPTPALLPGLIGMGVAAWRKRQGEVEVSEEA
ncbi:MAG TPA: PTPA-CTERM sorting domain-containing protein [Leptolyngbyaceae cyanobacterium M65_K2018_010]|nr:PTPA-CTERM sorting domain-containing protein [Leptolyngbyaceae cyanobacterium M65_K2018_010]